MSREAIENTIRAMRDRNAVAYLRLGILGNVSLNAGRRAEDICEMFAGRVEADVADILAENARLRDALKDAIQFSCLKCTFWNSRTARCSRGSGACTQVLNWKAILDGGAK